MNPNDLFPELKDIKPPVEMSQTPWLLIVLAVAVVIGIVAALGFMFRNKKSSKQALSPVEQALANLDKIRLDDLHRAPEAVAFYVVLSDVLRCFLERQFGLHAPEMTTEEFLSSLQDHHHLKNEEKVMLEKFLRQCDLVKFARQAPDVSEARRNFEVIRNFIKSFH